MKILIVFYSMYGHIYEMAKAVEKGAKRIKGTNVQIRRIPETLPEEVLKKMAAFDFQKSLGKIPLCTVGELAAADAIIFGTPTRFGNMVG